MNPRQVQFYTAPIANQDYSPPGTSMTGKVLLDTAKGQILYRSVIDDVQPGTATSSPAPSTAATAATSATSSAAAPKPNANGDTETCSL